MIPGLRTRERRALQRTAIAIAVGAATALAFQGVDRVAALGLSAPAPAQLRLAALPSELPSPDLRGVRDPFVPNRSLAVQTSGRPVVVRAVILGAEPHALLRRGRSTAVVGVGDAFAGLIVRRIDATGVVLGDVRLALKKRQP